MIRINFIDSIDLKIQIMKIGPVVHNKQGFSIVFNL